MPLTAGRKAIHLNYFIRIPNVGDRINPLLVGAIAGCATRWSPGGETLLAVGSMMAQATPLTSIWGTGIISPDSRIPGIDPDRVYAIRGKRTWDMLTAAGIPLRDIPLGDPGYLAPRRLGIRRSQDRTGRIGLVAHYVDRYKPFVAEMLADPRVVDLNVHAHPADFLQAMAQCDIVLSTSLHGLVFAEGLSIPNLWLSAGDDLVGGSFKFDDWFSTTREPQPAPRILEAGDTAAGLAKEARLHDCAIDGDALEAAFPYERLAQLSGDAPALDLEACGKRPTPVFIISFDRGDELRRCIAGLQHLSSDLDIVIHDNGSTEPRTLQVLEDLEAAGTRVTRNPAISEPDQLNQVDETVSAYFSTWAEPSDYVVTDCDIDMSVADPGALQMYRELLIKNRLVGCVGPMLRIRDIAQDYPLFNHVMNRHIAQFWAKRPVRELTSRGIVARVRANIDTTFALHRAGEPFRRLKPAVRVHAPYEALHMDWYRSPDEASAYASTSADQISHWGNLVSQDRLAATGLAFESYIYVDTTGEGELVFVTRRPADHPIALRKPAGDQDRAADAPASPDEVGRNAR